MNFGLMRFPQWLAAQMFTKKWRGRPYRDTDRYTDEHIISTRPHWGTFEPSVGINASQRQTQKLVIEIVLVVIYTRISKLLNTKKPKSPKMTGRTDLLYFHSDYPTLCPAAACAAKNYGVRDFFPKSNTDESKYRKTERQRTKQTYRHIILTGPHWVPSDPIWGGMHYYAGTLHW